LNPGVLGTKADFFPPYLYFSKERGKEIVVALKGGGREDKMGIVQYMPIWLLATIWKLLRGSGYLLTTLRDNSVAYRGEVFLLPGYS
jgi:hypothetical protein